MLLQWTSSAAAGLRTALRLGPRALPTPLAHCTRSARHTAAVHSYTLTDMSALACPALDWQGAGKQWSVRGPHTIVWAEKPNEFGREKRG